MTDAIHLLEAFLATLPPGHHEAAGVIRAIEVLRVEAQRMP